MAQIQKLIQENQKLKYQLEKFKSSNGLLPYIDDSAIKGGYHVVKNISERDSIDCCHRKLGMKVLVIGSDLSFKEYILKTDNCKENIWKEVDVTIEENEVFLIEDYSELSENLTTQKELNLILKQLILNLQTQIDNIFIEVTKTELDVLISENKLEPNRLYKITGVESWCFSQHLIKAIYLKAITNNTLESEGVGEFYTPKYNTSDSNLGIWKGELLANGMIDSLSYNIGDKVIWGNLFWENISGNVGTNIKEYYDEDNDEYFTPKLQSWLSNDWTLITPNNDESLYNVQFDKIKYDIENDYISYREDRFGNVYEISYSNLLDYFPDSSIVNFAPEFIYNINSIVLFQWGRNTNVNNNNISESIVLNCNYNCSLFRENNVLEKSIISDNNFLGVQFCNNNIKESRISYNYLKESIGIVNNDLEYSQIYDNKYHFNITDNKLRRNSQISNNISGKSTFWNKEATILRNTLDNTSTIKNNNFVEEGKGISGYSKGINDNILNNTCNINSNIVKNGSRIFGHTLEYYSTINGNTLDTDANIYNNQLIQNGKIDNNILTGHGRIYGNQLDRLSEITNCKLRISPATSYSTTMKNNRLFVGKIQNVDFGDIVNPVGTNPNDPNFGGNALSECIIENGSIIKDLTFPNHGGVGIQFVKMNGYSEFKNITVNDSIINVDFTNTIFNETSDYSKLIEGNGYQTNNFTKTYIDGILLKDKFDDKQDVLTEDNLGQLMDSELSTKSTPTSGDTVLGRDSVTGKAVEIPTSSLGGSGSSLALGEIESTAYRGDRGKIAYDHSQVTGNPHNTTKSDIGLGNVDNTSDLDKPISTATQQALNNKLDKETYTGTASDLKTEIDGKANTSHTHNINDVTNLQIALDNKQNAIGYIPENVANKATDLSSPDNTKFPTTLAVANENKKATITVELISQLTTNFYAPNALRINSTTLISGSGTLTLKVNDVAYTLGNLIPQGAKITAETTSASVYNLISIYE